MFHFVANLKDYTYHRGRGVRRFDSYLLSVDFINAHNRLARKAVASGHTLVADNGNFDRIRALIRENRSAMAANEAARKEEEKQLDRYARPGDLTPELVERYRRFAHSLAISQRTATSEVLVREVVQQQSALNPRYLIGMEDLTLPVLTALGVEPEYAQLGEDFYAELVGRALEYSARTERGEFGEPRGAVFAGLHAQDLDSARLGGVVAGMQGVAGIASGLGGALADRSYIDFRIANGELISLPRSIPRPYLRVAEIAAGFHLGYAESTGRRLRFHSLGVGTPILLVLLAALGDVDTLLASDSTAPIADAWLTPTIGLYVHEPATLKLKAHRISEYWLSDGLAWNCRCPYCRRFNADHPPDIEGARHWWQAQGHRRLQNYDMHSKSALPTFLPLLGFHKDPVLSREAALARVGHNHWVLSRIERAARAATVNPGNLLGWAENAVEAYLDSAAGTAWKAAVAIAWSLTRDVAQQLRDVEPTPPGWTRVRR